MITAAAASGVGVVGGGNGGNGGNGGSDGDGMLAVEGDAAETAATAGLSGSRTDGITSREQQQWQQQQQQQQQSAPSATPCYTALQDTPLPLPAYNLLNYLAYLLFPPLYLSGPIASFNAFIAQISYQAAIQPGTQAVAPHIPTTRREQQQQQQEEEKEERAHLLSPLKQNSLHTFLPARTGYIAQYGVRLLLSFLLMELMSHYCYFSSLASTASRWAPAAANAGKSSAGSAPSAISSPGSVALDAAVVSYGVINFTWLKFLLIWRFFRFFSLLSGVDAPENLPRCINNNCDIEGFWRSWHASYNKWIVRYLYVPMGGGRRKLFNAWVVFTFVALWHDFELHLLLWAWLTSLFFAPELLAKMLIALPSMQVGIATG